MRLYTNPRARFACRQPLPTTSNCPRSCSNPQRTKLNGSREAEAGHQSVDRKWLTEKWRKIYGTSFLLSAFCCLGVVCCFKVLRFPISVPRSCLNSSGRERKKTLSSTNEYQYPIVFDAHITVRPHYAHAHSSLTHLCVRSVVRRMFGHRHARCRRRLLLRSSWRCSDDWRPGEH